MKFQTSFPRQLEALHSQGSDQVAVYLQFAGTDDVAITYDQLLRGATAFARRLEREGIQAGEVVVLILQHGQELVYSFWGAILQGAIPSIMPFLTEKLSPERYRADLSSLISVIRPASIVTYPEFEADVRGALQVDDSVRAVIVTSQLEEQAAPDFYKRGGFQRSAGD